MSRRLQKETNSGAGVTVDHDKIREWVERRGGHPARVSSVGEQQTTMNDRVLRIGFGEEEETLEPMSWEEFFKVFDDNRLAFLYQENKRGKMSRFSKFVDRESVDNDNGKE